MNIFSLLSLFGVAVVKERIRRAQQRALWLGLAAVTGAGALVTFLCALQIVIARSLGPLYADLIIGVALLLLALCFLLAAKLVASLGRATDFPTPSLSQSSRAIVGKSTNGKSNVPLVVGASAIIGALVGRFFL